MVYALDSLTALVVYTRPYYAYTVATDLETAVKMGTKTERCEQEARTEVERERLHRSWEVFFTHTVPFVSCTPLYRTVGMSGRDEGLTNCLQLEGEILSHNT